jgi:hypothetical protein
MVENTTMLLGNLVIMIIKLSTNMGKKLGDYNNTIFYQHGKKLGDYCKICIQQPPLVPQNKGHCT